MARRVLAGSLIAVALPTLAACGDDESKRTLSKPEVIREANHICTDALDKSRGYASSHTQPSNAKEVAAALDETIKNEEPAVAELKKLRPPDEDRQVFEDFLSEEEAALTANREQRFAAARLESDEFTRLAARVKYHIIRIRSHADRYGIDSTKCARVAFPFSPPETAASGSNTPAPSEQSQTTEPPQNEQQQSEPTSVKGSWTGNGTQVTRSREQSSYPIRLTIRRLAVGAVAGTIDYPTFPCGGLVRLLRGIGDRYVLREDIRYGRRKCDRDGTIVITLSGSRLNFRWSRYGTVVQARLAPG
jgi:hypothetical protein